MKTKQIHQVLAALALSFGTVAVANAAGAIISNGTIMLGINDTGNLNVTPGAGVSGTAAVSQGGTAEVGMSFLSGGQRFESTAPGCLCEGWGVGLISTNKSGFANVSTDGGANSMSVVSFTSTASTAVSVVNILNGVTPFLQVTHNYKPSTVAGLYQVDVTIQNLTGSALAAGDLVYRRVMDWDAEPTAFSEYVTIQGVPTLRGVANGNNIRRVGNNGFATANPLSTGSLTIGSCAANANFVDCGVNDHGALFDFEFEALAAGASRAFTTYYGAASTEASALASLATVGAGLYSLGQPSNGAGGTAGETPTYIFGFGATSGGTLTPPPTTGTPEPGSLALLGLALMGVAFARRKATVRI